MKTKPIDQKMKKNRKIYLAIFILFAFPSVSFSENMSVQALEKKADYIYVEELDARVAVFPSVFRPDPFNEDYRKMIARTDLSEVEHALEIGTGSGVNALIALRSGAQNIVVTDINDAAVKCSRFNAGLFDFNQRFDARQVSMSEPGAFSVIKEDEKFDLQNFFPHSHTNCQNCFG